MNDQISIRIIFTDKNFDINGIKLSDTILMLKKIIKEVLINQNQKLDAEINKVIKNLTEEKIKIKIGFPPVTIEGQSYDSRKLNEMKITNNEIIRVEIIENYTEQEKIPVKFSDESAKIINTINPNTNPDRDKKSTHEPIDFSKYSVKRKVIPSDNSCLFNAVNFALNQNLSEPLIMRSLIAAEIQSNLDFTTQQY